MFWRMLIALGLVAVLTAVQPACVFACSCMPPGPPEEALASATAVFSGQVTSIAAPGGMGGSVPVQVTFAVARGWKGADQSTIVVGSSGSSASCGFEFVEGQEYLVYATEVEGRLQTSLCSRTTQLANAGEDLAVLGEGTKPSAPASGEETPAPLPATGDATASYLVPAALVGGLLLIVLLSSVVVTRRRDGA